MKTRLILILVLSSTLLLSACGGQPATGGNTAVPNAAKSTALPPAPTQAPNIAPTDVPTNNNNGNLDLSDVAAGLDALNSYQAIFVMSFDGTQDNQPKKWNLTSLEEYVKEPAAKHSRFVSTGTTADANETTFESWEVNGKAYVSFGTTCVASDSSTPPSANSSFTPSSVIGDIKGAQLLGAETVNGVPTQHFAVDVQHFAALGTYTDGQSEVWVATPGNYVVKYFFQATGKDAFFGGSTGDAQGTVRWDYEIKNVNQPINVAPPEGCGQSAADIPILPDAKNNSAFGDITTYTSATGFDEAVAFYNTQMTANGWSVDATGGMSAPNFATFSFKKDTRTASVTITFDTDKKETTVLISITK